MTKKLIITHDIDSSYKELLKAILPDWEMYLGKDPAIWLEHINEAEIIAGWNKEVKAALSNGAPNLKWLQAWSAGVNSLPLEIFKSNKIFLTSANGVHAYPISETIIGLMLALTRKIHNYVRNQQTKTWHHEGLSLEMHGKTVGIIGVGHIGKETAKIAKAFGMKVIGVRRSGEPEEFVDEMYKQDELNEILPLLDYVVITLPLTMETTHLFRKEQFQQMKSSAFLINIGRGEIVEEEALIKALVKNEIAGAGLDVFEKEPLSPESPLWELENVIITPHTSGSTEHYNKRVIENIFIPNLKSYLSEAKPSINVVDFVKGY